MKNTLIVRTPAQKEIFRQELQGQLSDGHWENENTDERLWDCEVIISDGYQNLGCNFVPIYPIDFEELEYVLDRAVEIGKTVDPDYSMDMLMSDLAELTEIVFG